MPLTDYEKFVNTEALLACQRPLDPGSIGLPDVLS